MSTEMTVAKMDTNAIRSIATGFVAKSAEIMTVVREAYQAAPEVYDAMTLAGQFAIEDSMTEADKAFIDRGIACGRILVEGGKTPSKERCYSVIAEAQSKGFAFASRQYSIWANGTLYVKEDGFRRAFEMRRDCSELDTKNDRPVWTKLQDRAYWEVPVEAWVTVKNRGIVRVKCTIGVNGNHSDSIAKIEAHAERSVLKKLWKKVTSIAIDASDDNDVVNGSVIVVEEQQATITEQPLNKADNDAEFASNLIRNQHAIVRKLIVNNDDQLRFYDDSIKELEEATTVEQFGLVRQAMNENKKGLKLSKDVAEHLAKFVKLRETELKGGAQ